MSAREPDPRLDSEARPGPESRLDPELLRAVPLLVRLAMGAWWRTTQWTVEASMAATVRLLRAAISGESTTDVLQETGSELREYLRRLLGVVEGGDGRTPTPEAGEGPPAEDDPAAAGNGARLRSLRERGAELLRQSADVTYDEEAHPAYDRILTQLAPDEGRILRLLATEGPEPAVDVRQSKPLNVSSQLVAPGLNMIGAKAGCRHGDRLPAYLNNLYRLGLIWFSREPLPDPLAYQVLESQPEVVEALSRAGRTKTVRRSIHLTAFGEDFCQVCLPLDTAELEALPGDIRPEPPRPPQAQGEPDTGETSYGKKKKGFEMP
jgi:hypothetical protein